MGMAGNVLVNANSLSPTKMAVWNWPALKAVWRQFLKKASILLLSVSLSVDILKETWAWPALREQRERLGERRSKILEARSECDGLNGNALCNVVEGACVVGTSTLYSVYLTACPTISYRLSAHHSRHYYAYPRVLTTYTWWAKSVLAATLP